MSRLKGLFLKAFVLVAFGLAFSYADSIQEYIDEINSVYHKIGLQGFGKGAYVQLGSNGKIDLKGDYKTYKDFEEAFYIAESIAGVSNVNPAFNVINANIVERPMEECIAYSMKNDAYKCSNIISAISNIPSGTKKLAILIAVGQFEHNHIPYLYPGPENDANLVADTLRKKGFAIEKLYDKDATLQNVENTIKNAIKLLPNGSTLVIYASSHGSPDTPIGETGVVLYNSYLEIHKHGGCNYSQNPKTKEAMSRDIVIANAVDSAQSMCYIVHSSLLISRDVLPLIAQSGKDINLVVIEDICYSGATFKNLIPDAKIDDVYAPTKLVAENLVGLDPYPMILITSASGEQRAEQAKINTMNGKVCPDNSKNKYCVTHGIFTYYYFTGLPPNDYYLYKTYKKEFPIIEATGGSLKKSISGQNNKDKTQTPLFISNKNLSDFKF
ncbi:caspase family protein [Hydrogenobaculum acidophilum]